MRVSTIIPILAAAGLGHAVPKNSCTTVTTEVVSPTRTYTGLSTKVVTTHPTTAENFGTVTEYTTEYSTTTVTTLTSTHTSCTATGVITKPVYKTVYTTAASNKKRTFDLGARAACTVTVTSTSYSGDAYTEVPANKTSTFYDYTTFTETDVTRTEHSPAYAIATATATKKALCGSLTHTASATTKTITRDARCSPAAITSAVEGYGIEYGGDAPAVFVTPTHDAAVCCQLCADEEYCSVSSWDVRTGQCKLEFNVSNGKLACGFTYYAAYDSGPDHPMAPGSGLYVATLCGDAQIDAAAPDDGT